MDKHEARIIGVPYQLPTLGEQKVTIAVRIVPFVDNDSRQRRLSLVSTVTDGEVATLEGIRLKYRIPDQSRGYPEGHIGLMAVGAPEISLNGDYNAALVRPPNRRFFSCTLTPVETARRSPPSASVNPPSNGVEAEWHYDPSGYYNYVLVNGGDDVVSRVKIALAEIGVESIQSGRSHQVADNGKQYNWYIRVTKKARTGYVTPSRNDIAKAFLEKRTGKAPSAQAATPDVVVLRKEAQQEKARREELQIRLDAEKRRADTAQVDLGRIQSLYDSLRVQQAGSERRLVELARDFDAYRTQLVRTSVEQQAAASSQLAEFEVANEQLRQENADLHVAWQETDAIRSRISEERDQLDNQKRIIEAQLEMAHSRLGELERTQADHESQFGQVSQKNVKREKNLETMLRLLLPNLYFARGSISFLANEVEDSSAVLRELHRLCHEPSKLRSKRVQAAGDWLETHFSTGDNDDGRLYFIKNKVNGRYLVLISHKGTQTGDILWLVANQPAKRQIPD